MEIEFTRIEGKSKQFHIFMGILTVIAAGGMLSTFLFFEKGLYLTGMSNRVPWGLSIVMAIFYIGLSAGSLVLSAMSSVFGKEEFKPFARVAAVLALFLLVGALMSITLDWGRPDRLFVPFSHFNPFSMFSLNAFLYNAYMAICFFYLLAMFAKKEKLVKLLALVAVLWAILVHSGTGAIFGFIPRELYHSILLPPSFVAAALSSGTALMIILLQLFFNYTNRPLDDGYMRELSKLLSIFIIVVFYFVVAENVFRGYLHSSLEAAKYFVFGGFHSVVFWYGLILMGIIIPEVLLFNPRTNKSLKWINVAAILHVIGVFCERYIIVVPGQTHPQDILPNYEVSSAALDGAKVTYSISFLEIAQALGIAAIVAIIVIMVLKFFPILPTKALMEEEQVEVSTSEEEISSEGSEAGEPA